MPDLNPLATEAASYDAMYVPSYLLKQSSTLTKPSTKRNQEQSPLLRLPAELRNRIFAHIVGPPGRSHLGRGKRHECKPVMRVAMTCRQIRAETYLRYLSQQTVLFQRGTFRRYMALFTAEQRNAIRKVHVYQNDAEAAGFWEAVGTLGSLEYVAFRLYRPRTNVKAVVSVSRARLERLARGRTVEFEALTEYELWPWEA
jgi:hypothetical protein